MQFNDPYQYQEAHHVGVINSTHRLRSGEDRQPSAKQQMPASQEIPRKNL